MMGTLHRWDNLREARGLLKGPQDFSGMRDLVSRERWGSRAASRHPGGGMYAFQTPAPALLRLQESGRGSERMRLAPGGMDAGGRPLAFSGWAWQEAEAQVSSRLWAEIQAVAWGAVQATVRASTMP